MSFSRVSANQVFCSYISCGLKLSKFIDAVRKLNITTASGLTISVLIKLLERATPFTSKAHSIPFNFLFILQRAVFSVRRPGCCCSTYQISKWWVLLRNRRMRVSSLNIKHAHQMQD